MAAPRIFVSLTCYDLQEVRGNLRDFIQGFGYEPIISDFGDNYGSSFHTNEKKHNEIPDSVTLKEFKEALDLEKSKMIFVNKYVDYDYNNYKRYLQTCYIEFFSQNEILCEDIEKKKMRHTMEKRDLNVSFYKVDYGTGIKITLPKPWLRKMGITEEEKQVELIFDEDEKKRDVCVNRLIGYVKEIIAFDEEVKRLNKEIKTRLSLIKLDSETYYDSLR